MKGWNELPDKLKSRVVEPRKTEAQKDAEMVNEAGKVTLKNLKEVNRMFDGKRSANIETPQQRTQALGRMKSGKMNKTEAAYADILETRKRAGGIVWWAFEPINIRLADKCFYSPDFMIQLASGVVEIHECKGRWEDDALVKIKVASELLPFKFIAMQFLKGQWIRRDF